MKSKNNLNNRETASSGYVFLKRILDIVLSIVGIVITSPIIIIACVLVKIESEGNSIYKQKRVGIDNKEFYIYKIRSMRNDAEVNGATWAQKQDPRITKIGKIIRKTRIDELPQLFNILKGDMALIGPRPEREMFYRQFEQNVQGFRKRLLVKPGLTGYAQVNGGYDLTPQEKLNLDLYYIENESFKLDSIIILKTISVIITGEGAR